MSQNKKERFNIMDHITSNIINKVADAYSMHISDNLYFDIMAIYDHFGEAIITASKEDIIDFLKTSKP